MPRQRGWWGGRPPITSRIDFSHPLAAGLTGFWSFSEGGGPPKNSLGTATFALSGASWVTNPRGRAVRMNAQGNYMTLGYIARLFPSATDATIMVRVRRNNVWDGQFEGAEPDIFSQKNNVIAQRILGMFPHHGSNGSFWDWGGDVGGTSRLYMPGELIGNYGDDILIATVGARGMELWRNGKRIGFQTGHAARDQSADATQEFRLGDSDGNNATNVDYSLAATWKRQLSYAEVDQLFDDPLAIYRPTTDYFSTLATPPQDMLPDSDVQVNTWTTHTGATTNLYQQIDETTPSDSDYIRTTTPPAGNVYEAGLSNATDPQVSDGHTVSVRALIDAAIGGATTLRTEVRQGISALSTPAFWDDVLGTSPATFSHTLSGAQTDAITDYSDLRLRFTVTQGTPDPPEFAAVGNSAGLGWTGTGATAVAWPAGHQAGDVALLLVESTGGQAATLGTANGFAAVTNSPQSTGNTTSGTRLTAFWCRATSGSMSSPTVVIGTGNHGFATILTFRKCISSGNPWDVTGGGVKATSNTTVSVAGVNTTVDNCLVVASYARDLPDAAGAQFSGQANATLTGVAELFDQGTASGNGGGIGVWSGVKATAGATGTFTATIAGAVAHVSAFLTIALRPEANGSQGQVTWAKLSVPGLSFTTSTREVASSAAFSRAGLTRQVSASGALSQANATRQVASSAATSRAGLTRQASASVAVLGVSTRQTASSVAVQSTLARQTASSVAVLGVSTRQISVSAAFSSGLNRQVAASVALSATQSRAVAGSAAVSTANLIRQASASVALSVAATIPYTADFEGGADAAWEEVDTAGLITYSNGRADFENGGSANWTDHKLVYGPMEKSLVGAFGARLRMTNNVAVGGGAGISLSPSGTDPVASGSGAIVTVNEGVAGIDLYAPRKANTRSTRSIDYDWWVVPRPDGGWFLLVSGGEYGVFPNATLVGIVDGGTNEDPLYAHIAAKQARFSVEHAKVLAPASLPTSLTTRFGPALAADDFQAFNGTNVSGRTLPFGSGTWAVSGGSGVTTQSSRAAVTSGAMMLVNLPAAPKTIIYNYVWSGSGSIEFLFRGDGTYTNTWNFWYWDGNGAWGLEAPTSIGGGTVQSTGAYDPVVGGNTIRIVDHGTYIQCWNNDDLIFTHVSTTNNTFDQVGYYATGSGNDIEDFSAWPATVTLNSDFGPAPAIPAGQGDLFFAEVFPGADGADLPPVWTEDSGDWEQRNGRGQMKSASVNGIATADSGTDDHEVQATTYNPNTTPTYPTDWFNGVFFRATDATHYLYARKLLQNGSNEIELQENLGSGQQLIAYVNLQNIYTAGGSNILRTAVKGQEVAVYLDDELVLQATTSLTTGTRFGIGVSDNLPNGQPSWDNISVKSTISSFTREIAASAALSAQPTRQIAASAAVQSTLSRQIAASSAISRLNSVRQVTTAAATAGTFTRQVATSAVLLAVSTRQVGASVALSTANLTRQVGASVALLSVNTRQAAASVAVLRTLTRQVSESAALQTTASRSVASSGALLSTPTRQVSTTAGVSRADLTRQVQATVATSRINQTRAVGGSVALSLAGLTRAVGAAVALLTTSTRLVSGTASLYSTLTRQVSSSAATSQAGIARQVSATVSISLTGTEFRQVSTSAAFSRANTSRQVATAAALTTLAITRQVATSVALLSTPSRAVASTTAFQSTPTRQVASTASLSATILGTTRQVPAFVALQATASRQITSSIALLSVSSRQIGAITALSLAGITRQVSSTVSISSANARFIDTAAALSRSDNPRAVSVAVALARLNLVRQVPTATALYTTFSRQVATSASITVPQIGAQRQVAVSVSVSLANNTRAVSVAVALSTLDLTRQIEAATSLSVADLARQAAASVALSSTGVRTITSEASFSAVSTRVVQSRAALATLGLSRSVAIAAVIGLHNQHLVEASASLAYFLPHQKGLVSRVRSPYTSRTRPRSYRSRILRDTNES